MTACASYEACLSLLVPTVRIMSNHSTPQGPVAREREQRRAEQRRLGRAEIKPFDGCVRLRVSRWPLYRAYTVKCLSAPHLAVFRNQSPRGNEAAVRRDDSSSAKAKKDCDLGLRAMRLRIPHVGS